MKKKLIDNEDFFDDCPICQTMKSTKENGREPALKELKKSFKEAEEKGAIVGGSIFEKEYDDFQMPKWMECTWRRVPCGRDDCPICGRIKKDRQEHIRKGEDPDSIESAMEDVKENLKETLEIVKDDCEKWDIDITNIEDIKEPPEAEEFPLYKKVAEWRDEVFNIVENARIAGDFWVFTETTEDLTWYSNLLPAKVYRQLCNKWHIKNGDDYGEFDYKYTQGIIKECLGILKESLSGLYSNHYKQKADLMLVYGKLINFEKEILDIQ